MKIISTKLQGVLILEPAVHKDNRGFFYENWSEKEMEKNALYYSFVQDNHSFSADKGTLRGIHFQKGEFAQAKLVRCTRGRIVDVAIDLRLSSQSYGQSIAVELSAENYLQLLIPKQFGHGFVTLEDNCEVQYKVDYPYAPQFEGGVIWNDSRLAIDWGVQTPILSKKDGELPCLSDIENTLWQ